MKPFLKDEWFYFLKVGRSITQHSLNFPPGEKPTIKEMENTALTFQEFSMWGGGNKRRNIDTYSQHMSQITT